MWKERREKLNLTQEDFAKIVGVSSRTILRHEAGKNRSPAVTRLIELTLTRIEKRRRRN